jgi:hypothetical protein
MRTHRTPLSIWIVAVLSSLAGAWQVFLVSRTSVHGLGLTATVIALMLALLAYQAWGLIRLSRWPIVLHVGGVVWSMVSRHLAGVHWRDQYPFLGPFIVLVPLAIYLALTLPHWRKMNWALFGRPYRPPEDRAEVFA